ncbi:alpha/beta fold hydrolase [Gloeocapsa sp. PCC 73106]|uniref:alpha/beta fold hydrolase n=1 Tax=Gloeocapsa sp. PCC 73106 TaxID=102232 RepID=UPI0002ABD88E|nr:alpha/beta fold hydrolase [Gloeocapsa sp. PCC 73106]ELR99120.1 putative hydrolase or acyltransferase of alpha/beta superfamily [Gloeocapsa sp. PCC 73106]
MTITETTLPVGKLSWYLRQTPQSCEDPPILLLHGIPAHSYTWRKILPELAKAGFGAIAPDWLGFGASAKPDHRDFDYTPQAYLNALTELLTTLDLSYFSLVVQGFLASVGIQYALTHPEAIHRLIILNTPLVKSAKLPWSMGQWTIPLAGEMLTQDPLLIDRTLEKGSGFVINEPDLAQYRQPFLRNSAAGRSLMTATRNLQLTQSLNQIELGLATWTKPTLILWGMADPWLNSDSIENLAQSNANLEFRKLPLAKHYPQEHWFEEINPKIINFLRRQSL